jgi:hypothetical protein
MREGVNVASLEPVRPRLASELLLLSGVFRKGDSSVFRASSWDPGD